MTLVEQNFGARKEEEIMDSFGMPIDVFEKDEDLEGKVFELFEKTANREFKRHVQFIKAENLCAAEDKASEANPEYWRTKSVRPVKVEYVWETFVELYFSYRTAKSILGIDELLDE